MPDSLAAGEQIPPQAHGLDHRFGAPRILELAAQAADARVDRAVEPVVVDAANDAQDLVASHHLSLARGEEPQDVEVAGGEFHRPRVDLRGAPRAVDAQPPGGKPLLAAFARRGART